MKDISDCRVFKDSDIQGTSTINMDPVSCHGEEMSREADKSVKNLQAKLEDFKSELCNMRKDYENRIKFMQQAVHSYGNAIDKINYFLNEDIPDVQR